MLHSKKEKLIRYKALSNPIRLDIAFLLVKKELSVGEIAKKIGQSMSTVSHALNYLRKAGIVEVKLVDKNKRHYGFTQDTLKKK